MRTIFVTGTDTGAGKTFVAAGLVQGLVGGGERVAAFKPVASGARLTSDGLRNDDALSLLHASNAGLSYNDVNPYCFAEPIAPHIAAARAGVSLSAAAIAEHVARLRGDADWVVVEGAGGWLVPLSYQETFADIAQALGASVLLVVPIRLGCINHALLTWRAMAQSGLAVLGWVANVLDPGQLALTDQIDAISHWVAQPPRAIISFQHDFTRHDGCDWIAGLRGAF